jgi:hypothetical protein
MTVFDQTKFFFVRKKPWSESGTRTVSGFSNSLDLDPDSAKCLDPDLVNPDPKHCSELMHPSTNSIIELK